MMREAHTHVRTRGEVNDGGRMFEFSARSTRAVSRVVQFQCTRRREIRNVQHDERLLAIDDETKKKRIVFQSSLRRFTVLLAGTRTEDFFHTPRQIRPNSQR